MKNIMISTRLFVQSSQSSGRSSDRCTAAKNNSIDIERDSERRPAKQSNRHTVSTLKHRHFYSIFSVINHKCITSNTHICIHIYNAYKCIIQIHIVYLCTDRSGLGWICEQEREEARGRDNNGALFLHCGALKTVQNLIPLSPSSFSP